MRNVIIVPLALLLFTTGCKKETPTPAHYVLSVFTDSTSAGTTNFSYDAQGRLIKFYSGTTSYDFYFSGTGNNVMARTYTLSGILQKIDSFFYDISGQLIRVSDYDGAADTLVKTTTFVYNGDNTMNSATVVYMSSATPNEYYGNTYNSTGQLTDRKGYAANSLGDFVPTTELQYLSYDNKQNPFGPIYPYRYDQFNLFGIIYALPNNPTAAKQISYDANTGNISGVYLSEVSYTYDSNNLPTSITSTDGVTTTKFYYSYIKM